MLSHEELRTLADKWLEALDTSVSILGWEAEDRAVRRTVDRAWEFYEGGYPRLNTFACISVAPGVIRLERRVELSFHMVTGVDIEIRSGFGPNAGRLMVEASVHWPAGGSMSASEAMAISSHHSDISSRVARVEVVLNDIARKSAKKTSVSDIGPLITYLTDDYYVAMSAITREESRRSERALLES